MGNQWVVRSYCLCPNIFIFHQINAQSSMQGYVLNISYCLTAHTFYPYRRLYINLICNIFFLIFFSREEDTIQMFTLEKPNIVICLWVNFAGVCFFYKKNKRFGLFLIYLTPFFSPISNTRICIVIKRVGKTCECI